MLALFETLGIVVLLWAIVAWLVPPVPHYPEVGKFPVSQRAGLSPQQAIYGQPHSNAADSSGAVGGWLFHPSARPGAAVQPDSTGLRSASGPTSGASGSVTHRVMATGREVRTQ